MLLFHAAVSIGELRRGMELIRHRGDQAQALLLEQRLDEVLDHFKEGLLPPDRYGAAAICQLRRAAQLPLDFFCLRGPKKVYGEWALMATTHNLLKLFRASILPG